MEKRNGSFKVLALCAGTERTVQLVIDCDAKYIRRFAPRTGIPAKPRLERGGNGNILLCLGFPLILPESAVVLQSQKIEQDSRRDAGCQRDEHPLLKTENQE